MRERINSAAVRKYVFSRLRKGEMVAGDLELKWALGFLETLKTGEKRRRIYSACLYNFVILLCVLPFQ